VSFSPEAQRIIEAQREDLNRVRGDVVKELDAMRIELQGSNERLAGHTLAVYKLTEQRLAAFERQFNAFASESKEHDAAAMKILLELQGRGVDEKRRLHRAVTWIAIRTGWNPEATRLALVAFGAALLASTLTACTLQVFR